MQVIIYDLINMPTSVTAMLFVKYYKAILRYSNLI